ncbi:MAG: hypothetical protein ABIO79_07505 [Ferruginibacter sp.]
MKKLTVVFMLLAVICSSAYKLPVNRDIVKAKMYFSNKPFTTGNAGSKKSFSSSEYIYGRIELEGQSIKDAFKVWDPSAGYPYSFLLHRVFVFHNGQELGHNTLNICLLEQKDKNKLFFNFDVLPEPSKASMVMSGIERFDAGIFSAPLYGLFDAYNFKEDGEYRIVVKFYYESYDVYGNRELIEKWPTLEDEFTFNFTLKDVPMLKKNGEAANTAMETYFKTKKPK